MQKTALWTGSVVGFSAIALLFFTKSLLYVDARQEMEYLQFQNALAHAEVPLEKNISLTKQQYRRGVCKDIWRTAENGRLHARLISDHSELKYLPENAELVEDMTDMDLWIQQEFYWALPDGREAVSIYEDKALLRGSHNAPIWIEVKDIDLRPMQKIDYIHAQIAQYSSLKQCLIAHNVTIWRYVLPLHDLKYCKTTDQPIVQSFADKLEISFAQEGQWKFKANQFRTSFYAAKNGDL